MTIFRERNTIYIEESLPGGGGGGGGFLFPCSPEIIGLFPITQKSKICFLMFPVPQYCLCSPVPLKIKPLFPCSPELIPFSPVPRNPWEGLIGNYSLRPLNIYNVPSWLQCIKLYGKIPLVLKGLRKLKMIQIFDRKGVLSRDLSLIN